MDATIFFLQIIAALTDRLRSRWRYFVAFLLTDLLFTLSMLVDAVYSFHFKKSVGDMANLLTTVPGMLLLLGIGLAGVAIVRLIMVFKI
jgi:hypothetical protein